MFSLVWNTIFTVYWEVLVLDFSEIGNTYCLFWSRKLMERWYLLIAEKFLLFWTFLRWKIRSLWAKKLMERWYLLITEKFLFRTIRRWEMRSFFWAKNLTERWYLLVVFMESWKVRFYSTSNFETLCGIS